MSNSGNYDVKAIGSKTAIPSVATAYAIGKKTSSGNTTVLVGQATKDLNATNYGQTSFTQTTSKVSLSLNKTNCYILTSIWTADSCEVDALWYE